jgi:hypothetical protein
MALDLDTLDLSSVDSLAAIKTEQDQLSDRLKAMAARRDQVSAEVFARVHDDYRRRYDELSQQAAPLKSAAGGVYRALKAELASLDAAVASAAVDREEIEFRHSLGEFDANGLKERLAVVEKRLGAQGTLREKALALKQRFLAVVASEAELDADDADTARMTAMAAPDGHSATVISAPVLTPPGDHSATIVAPGPPVPAPPAMPAATVATGTPPPVAPQTMPLSTPASKPTKPRNPDATVVFRQGRLEPRNGEAGSVVQTLGLKPVSIGSDPACDLQLASAGVAKKHVEITMTRAGFQIRDVAASKSVKVNGEIVAERVLAEGDTISIGAAQFGFRLM